MQFLKFWYILVNDISHNFSNYLKLFVTAVVKFLFNCTAIPVGWCQSKKASFSWLDDQLLSMVLQWLLNDSIAILWKSREEWWNPLCASICTIIKEIRKGKEGNESEDMLLQTLTPLAELAVPATLAIMPIYPPLPPPSVPIQTQFVTLGLRTSPPVLVSGPQGLGLVSPSKTWQGTQFGLGATPRAGQFPLCHYPVGGLNANEQLAGFLRLV